MKPVEYIRNFAIIAHIDHGKTTLTDRLLELTGAVEKRKMHERFLDSHPVAQTRGVTIKLAPVTLKYKYKNKIYQFNLIDTPGHMDFSYEVERSLAACEGALLLVDAIQGIQAQTLACWQLAKKLNLTILPVINKIDLANAEIEKTAQALEDTFGFSLKDILLVSAKTGENVEKILPVVIEKIPFPKIKTDNFLRALVFNSFYHPHKGVILYLKIISGNLKKEPLLLWASQKQFTPLEIGYFTPEMKPLEKLESGEVGYVATGLKEINLCQVGDTLTTPVSRKKSFFQPIAGYKKPKPLVFFDFYPVENKNFSRLYQAVSELKLNDSALSFSLVGSTVLGKGLRMGFLGVFHAFITQERLEHDNNLKIVITNPSVEYQAIYKDFSKEVIYQVSQIKDFSQVEEIREPWIEIKIFSPAFCLGKVFELCRKKRAKFINQEYYGDYIGLIFQMPLIELIEGFYDQLKSVTSGFASLDYRLIAYRKMEAVKLEVFINKKKVESFSRLVEKSKAENLARKLAEKLKAIIPRQLFEVPIQIALNNKIVARETIKAYRKDVTAKLYGGDQTRKDKLLEKQKKGKKRMKKIGEVVIPQEAFLTALTDFTT